LRVAKRRQHIAAGVSPQKKRGKRTQPRSGDSNRVCCRRFAAQVFVFDRDRGLTPTATCCRRFAADKYDDTEFLKFDRLSRFQHNWFR
jgi:hypothetical protein